MKLTLPLRETVISTMDPICSIPVSATFGDNTWPTANKAFFVPFRITKSLVIINMFWYNASVVNGYVDVGVYSLDGTRLVSSGSTAQVGAASLQSVAVVPTNIGPGVFYAAMVCDDVIGRYLRIGGSVATNRMLGIVQQTSAFPLPAVAVFAQFSAGVIPYVCMTTRSVI